jgi:hypothetical protein
VRLNHNFNWAERFNVFTLQFFGGDGKGDTPVPIPNTEVKPFSADGTAWETVWESRSPPKFIHKKAPMSLRRRGFFFSHLMLFIYGFSVAAEN